jgi:hypothetical protein
VARTRHRVPRERCALRLLPWKQQVLAQSWYPWLFWCGGVIAQASASSGAHRDVLFPSGGLGHKGSSAGRLLVPPSFTLLGGPFFSGERCRRIHPSSRSFNRSPGHYPGVRRTNLSAACSPVEAVGKTTGPWAELPFACGGRGADPAPDNDPGA